nr:cytochrome c biogenesis protein CcdC [Brevibacillus dissolubilis]
MIEWVTQIDPAVIGVVGSVVGLFMASTLILYRMRAAKRPVSFRNIIIPPVMMSTGFAMFHFPGFALPASYDLVAFFVGVIFSIPLILSSKFEVKGKEIYLKSSKAFIGILLGLFVIRFVIKLVMGDVFTPLQTAGLFFILAYGMILPWRVAMAYMYRQLVK